MTRLLSVPNGTFARKSRLRAAGLTLSFWCAGCVFFDNGYDACFKNPDCSTQDSGDGDSSTDGTTSTANLGGSHDGDGGSKTGGRSDGGQTLTDPSGGRPAISSGGFGSGGRADSPAGGLGGADPGAGGETSSGGDPGTGGEPSTDGSGGGAPLSRVTFNEFRPGETAFIELYNGTGADVDCTHLYVTSGTTDPDYSDPCALAAVGTLGPGAFLEVTLNDDCRGPGVCVSACAGWQLEAGDTIFLLDDSTGLLEVVGQRTYPMSVALGIGQSYSAYPDGGSKFYVRTWTPGQANAGP